MQGKFEERKGVCSQISLTQEKATSHLVMYLEMQRLVPVPTNRGTVSFCETLLELVGVKSLHRNLGSSVSQHDPTAKGRSQDITCPT